MVVDSDWLQRRARQAAPMEACGFIFDDGGIVEIRNAAINPYSSFKMDLRQANEAIRGKSIAAIWHTHPSGTTNLSRGDIEGIHCGAVLSHWRYFIVTVNEIKEWPVSEYITKPQEFWEAFVK